AGERRRAHGVGGVGGCHDAAQEETGRGLHRGQPTEADWRRASRGPGDGLRLGEDLEPFDAALATDARALVAAERRVGAVPQTAVEPERAGADAARHRLRAIEVAG